jgi:hypothetical protein
MGFYNLRVTGNMFRMPYQVYESTYEIAPKFIWQNLRPAPFYRHKQIQDFNRGVDLDLFKLERTVVGFIVKNAAYLSWWLVYSLNVYLLGLIRMFPVMVLWTVRSRWGSVAFLTYCFFACGVFLLMPLMIHYSAPITSLNYVFVLQSLRLWEWRDSRRKVGRPVLWLVLSLALVGLFVSAYSRVSPNDPSLWYEQRGRVSRQLKEAEGNHLIIVSYGPEHLANQEWVHNAADIDQAKVVWARPISSAEDCKLAKYFKERHLWLLNLDRDSSLPELRRYSATLCQ